MLKICVTTAITEKEKQNWHIFASTRTNLITLVDCVKIVTLRNIILKENRKGPTRKLLTMNRIRNQISLATKIPIQANNNEYIRVNKIIYAI